MRMSGIGSHHDAPRFVALDVPGAALTEDPPDVPPSPAAASAVGVAAFSSLATLERPRNQRN